MNYFKSRLAERARQHGLWLSLGSATAAEICATAGYDWLLIDCEHAPNDLNSVLSQLHAIEPHTAAVVRPLSSDAAHVKPLLDIGVQNLLVPMIESAEQARELVGAVRYPPSGNRGVATAMIRASGYGRRSNYIPTAHGGLCVMAQIETPTAVTAAAEIAAVDGIDALFVGLYDLCATMGYIDNPTHPDVLNTLAELAATAHRAGTTIGTYAPTAQLAQSAVLAGCKLIAYGSDVGLLARAATDAVTSQRPM
ncbi:HpcH/HpaI aldolase family protein [Mycolicibacterium tusciae]|uniref:HpcH/HpaI aldolase family protein n=1 Tax=Mycolicibacterium tusciae TaxID=75922 RepID=UPI00024A3FAF|nr:aldolase/citrate lyase family protein [Mycolicibacterium tusciae]